MTRFFTSRHSIVAGCFSLAIVSAAFFAATVPAVIEGRELLVASWHAAMESQGNNASTLDNTALALYEGNNLDMLSTLEEEADLGLLPLDSSSLEGAPFLNSDSSNPSTAPSATNTPDNSANPSTATNNSGGSNGSNGFTTLNLSPSDSDSNSHTNSTANTGSSSQTPNGSGNTTVPDTSAAEAEARAQAYIAIQQKLNDGLTAYSNFHAYISNETTRYLDIRDATADWDGFGNPYSAQNAANFHKIESAFVVEYAKFTAPNFPYPTEFPDLTKEYLLLQERLECLKKTIELFNDMFIKWEKCPDPRYNTSYFMSNVRKHTVLVQGSPVFTYKSIDYIERARNMTVNDV